VSDKKITELNNITSANLSDVDEFVVVDVSGGETKAITYGELKQFNGAISSDTLDLNAIAESKAVTAVDVFVYDTSKDSDGGAWRKRTQGTSWYNETLDTATRGSRKEFPAVAVIVAEADKLTIYDGDDPSLPMWMVFTVSSANALWRAADSVFMLNGKLVVGSIAGGYGVSRIDFLSETCVAYAPSNYVLNGGLPIAQRNAGGSFAIVLNGQSIVNALVYDVAMTVLPAAPIDPATGLPVPTIAVATDGGVSVIKDGGTVVDIPSNNAFYPTSDVMFSESNQLFCALSYNGRGDYGYVWVFDNIPTSDVAAAGSSNPAASYSYDRSVTPNFVGSSNTPQAGSGPIVSLPNGAAMTSQGYGPSGVRFLLQNTAAPANGMVAYTTSTYNTGWMNGDTKGAFLSDTDDTDLVGGTDNDRSVNANPLTVNGTVTRTAVATGADLVAYSGFSASNYLEQPYNSDLDFGTGDFCVMGWASFTSTGSQVLLSRTAISGGSRTGAGFQISNSSDSFIFDITDDGYASFDRAEVPFANNTGVMQHICCLRSGSNAYIYVNGVLAVTKAISNAAGSLSNATATLTVGAYPAGTVIGQFPWGGSLALWRISATAPSAEQIAKMYNDEKVLFQENAQATLYGSSDAVTALAHDNTTNLLHVGTSAGRSVFQGLRRVSNTTTAVGTAISASNGLVVEE